MTLKEAVKIAKDCGLITYEEALLNINLHVLNLFAYEEIDAEMEELVNDFMASGHKIEDKI